MSNTQYISRKDAKDDEIALLLYLSSSPRGDRGVMYENSRLSAQRQTERQLERAKSCEGDIRPMNDEVESEIII